MIQQLRDKMLTGPSQQEGCRINRFRNSFGYIYCYGALLWVFFHCGWMITACDKSTTAGGKQIVLRDNKNNSIHECLKQFM